MSQTPHEAACSALSVCLDRLLELLHQGNWEQLPDISRELFPALDAVRDPTLFQTESASVAQIKLLLEKLKLATNECQERKSQIAPLLEAFAKNRSVPGS